MQRCKQLMIDHSYSPVPLETLLQIYEEDSTGLYQTDTQEGVRYSID